MKLMYGIGMCLLGLFSILRFYGVNGQQPWQQPFHNGLTQNASVLCYRNNSDYCLVFELEKNADTIKYIFTRDQDDPTINSASVLPPFPDAETTAYLQICWTFSPVSITDSFDLSLHPKIEGDVVSLDIVSKSFWDVSVMDQINFPNDVVYRAACNSSEMVDGKIVSGSLSVNGSLEEAPNSASPDGELKVIVVGQGASSVTELGNDIYLEASVLSPANPTSLVPTGIYIHSCWVCDVATCDGIHTVPIVKADGCANLPQVGSFKWDSGSGNSKSDIFPAFQLNSQPILYFSCTAGFCFDASDQKCLDYCVSTGGTGKRKRRQADTEEEKIESLVVQFVVLKPGNGMEKPKPVESTNGAQESDTALIAAVVALAGLLLVGAIVAVVVFFIFSRRTPVNEKA